MSSGISMTPREICEELDKHIVGQEAAKKQVSVAMRDRWRRQRVDAELKDEIIPKNVLMIGPTGVGKTEIVRRLAKLIRAPYIKVEATKFTEVGYVGRDVDSIIRDLMDVAIKMARESAFEKVKQRSEEAAEDRVIEVLLPKPKIGFHNAPDDATKEDASAARAALLKKLRAGELDDQEIEIDVASPVVGVEIMAPLGMEEMTSQIQSMIQNFGGDKHKKKRKIPIKEAMRLLREEESEKLVDEEKIKLEAMENVEQGGIVFLDELDKVVKRSDAGGSGGEVSREGVQRDLLPLVEGCTVSTKYGAIKTDHILFIASGAFHVARPSDLIPELQGRFPVRVELKALTAADFERILMNTEASLPEQYQALLATEGLTLVFKEDAIKRLAEIAFNVNEKTENIGARRLHTVMERLLESLSFHAPDMNGQTVAIDAAYVNKELGEFVENEDWSRYIL